MSYHTGCGGEDPAYSVQVPQALLSPLQLTYHVCFNVSMGCFMSTGPDF